MTLRTLNYGNYGIFLMMGHARFMSSTVLYRNPLKGSTCGILPRVWFGAHSMMGWEVGLSPVILHPNPPTYRALHPKLHATTLVTCDLVVFTCLYAEFFNRSLAFRSWRSMGVLCVCVYIYRERYICVYTYIHTQYV